MVKVAVVTGGNRGIGLEIVRGLCKKFNGVVYLTARNEENGKQAVDELKKVGLNPKFHQLDITVPKSVEDFGDYIKEKYGGIDILVNNAGVMLSLHDAKDSATIEAESTIFMNYFSLLSLCEILLPIVRDGGRVINMTSSLGHLSAIPSEEYKNKFLDPELTILKLSGVMQEYLDDMKKRINIDKWGDSSYVVSKCGVTALSFLQQKLLNDRDIKVNAVHPGFVKTGLTSFKGFLSPAQGAIAALYVALEAPDSLKGKFVWYNKEIVRFDGPKPPVNYEEDAKKLVPE